MEGTIQTISYDRHFTYLLTPCSRVLHEKLTSFAANQEIPCILWNPKVHYHTHKRLPPVPILTDVSQKQKFGQCKLLTNSGIQTTS